MAKNAVKVETVKEEEFIPEVEAEAEETIQVEVEPTKKSKVKTVLKKIGTGIGIGLLVGAGYVLGCKTAAAGKKEEEPLCLDCDAEKEVIEVDEF